MEPPWSIKMEKLWQNIGKLRINVDKTRNIDGSILKEILTQKKSNH